MSDLNTATSIQRYYGKYRGTCVNNIDPMQQGRIQVIVPDVSSVLPSSWAMPCFPVTGIQNGVPVRTCVATAPPRYAVSSAAPTSCVRGTR